MRRWPPASARRRRASAATTCWSRNTSQGRAISKSRCSATAFGDCVYLFERDCSVQRRHQKVLEEAPAPGMTPQRRAAMGAAAVAAAKAVGYVGAGTVEFIATQDGAFYLHGDEHPPAGRASRDRDDHRPRSGRMAIARRLRRAPAADAGAIADRAAMRWRRASMPRTRPRVFCPRPANLLHLAPPEENLHVRVDAGVEEGDSISPYYDPMIAKLIVWDADRDRALARMLQALRRLPRRRRRQQHRFPVAPRRLPGLRARRSRHRADRARARLSLPRGPGRAA